MLQTNVNYIAILVAAGANMVIGALWYSPLLFAKPWMALTGKSMDQMNKDAAVKGYVGSAVLSLIQAYVLAVILQYMQANNITNGIIAGFFVWLGFVVTTSGSDYLFDGRPMNLFTLNTGYRLVALVVMGAILGAWI